MKGYFALMKLSMRNRLGAWRRDSWYKPNGKLDVGRIATTALILFSFVWLAGLILFAEIKLFEVLAMLGQPMLLTSLALLAALVSTLLLGILMVVSTLYFSKDSQWLSYLPVSSYAVLGMRWTVLWAGDVLINLALIGPAAVMFGLQAEANLLYYLRALIVILATPLIPLSIATLLASLLSRLTVLARNRDAVTMVGSLFVVLIVVGLEMTILPRIPEDADALYFVQLLLNREGLINLLLGSFPPILWAVRGMSGDWLNWLMFLGVSLGACALSLLLVGKDYMSICVQQTEHASKKKRLRGGKNVWQDSTPVMALCRREWNEIIKTPVYAMNALTGVIMVPLMFVIILLGMQSSGEDMTLIVPMLQGMLTRLDGLDLMLILTAVFSFACLMNPAACTSVSREGARLMISRMIPVPARTQLNAKLLVSMTLNLVTNAVLFLILCIVLSQYVIWIVLALVLATFVSYTSSAAALTIDCIRPQLHWANETQAMKQNFNFAIMMLIFLILAALPVGAVLLLMKYSAGMRAAAVIVVLLAEAAGTYLLMKHVAVTRYSSLEG